MNKILVTLLAFTIFGVSSLSAGAASVEDIGMNIVETQTVVVDDHSVVVSEANVTSHSGAVASGSEGMMFDNSRDVFREYYFNKKINRNDKLDNTNGSRMSFKQVPVVPVTPEPTTKDKAKFQDLMFVQKRQAEASILAIICIEEECVAETTSGVLKKGMGFNGETVEKIEKDTIITRKNSYEF